MKPIYIGLCLLLAFSCKTETKPEVEAEPLAQEKSTQTATDDHFDESGFEPLDISEYLSDYLLIGDQEKLRTNDVRQLHILGHDAYDFNPQGRITKTENATNNFSEYAYNKKGQIKRVLYKQHHPPLTYLERSYTYKDNNELMEVFETKFNKISEIETKKIISESKDLDQFKKPFKRAVNFGAYKINTNKRMILNYRTDLMFCCGEGMDGENRLLYYYGFNGLIDSLVIQNIDSSKTMTFNYNYE